MLRNRVMSSLVQIDGSLGGGQVLRIALSLSTLYGIPFKIENIRAGRPKPGLTAQHLKGVEFVKEMCNAQVRGGHIGSKRLEFHPGPLNKTKKTFVVDAQTAGCICLLAQVALPCALFFPCNDTVTLIFKCGSNVPMGPNMKYLTEVFRPMLNKFGADFDFFVVRRGYYPKDRNEAHLSIKPVSSLNAVTLTDVGIPRRITGWSYVAGSVHISEAHTMANDAKGILTHELVRSNIRVPPITIEAYREDRATAVGDDFGINIVCNTSTGCVFGGSALGSRNQEGGRPPSCIAVNEILKPFLTGACVDEYIQDQMIILMALAKGTSKIKVGDEKLTCHTEAAMQIAEIMLGKRGLRFNLPKNAEDGDTSSYVLECQGCGLINDNLVKQ